MLEQNSRKHFLFNGKFGIEISWARNSHVYVYFFVGKSCEQQSGALPYFFNMANSARKNFAGQGQTPTFFKGLFYKQNIEKTQSYLGFFKKN